MVTKADWNTAMEQIAQGAQQQMQGHPGKELTVPADFQKKVRAEVDQVLPYEELVGLHAKELSGLYSEQEIVDLLAFHKSPLGQKYLKASPQEADKVAQAMQQRFGQKMPEIMKRLTATLPHPAPGKKMPAGHPGMPAAPAPAPPSR
jgi:hypothetical protein